MARTGKNRANTEGLSNFRSIAMHQLIDNEVRCEFDDDLLPLFYVQHSNKQVKRDAFNYIAG